MKINKHIYGMIGLVLTGIFLAGCTSSKGAKERLWSVRSQPTEPEWIRNGEPITFEGELWFPADSTENLLDSEVYQVGEYKEIPIYIELMDVKPYGRLYTKFGRHKFRFFERKEKGD